MAALISRNPLAGKNLAASTSRCFAWVLALALGSTFSACLNGSSENSGKADPRGTWIWSASGCGQILSLDRDGKFEFAMLTQRDSAAVQERVMGNYELSRKSRNRFDIRFVPATPVDSHSTPYCDQWARRKETELTSSELENALGVSPSNLYLHEEISDQLGKVVIAAGADGVDRYALYRVSDVVSLLRLDQYQGYSWPLFNTLPANAARDPGALLTVPDIEIPEASFVRSFAIDIGFVSPDLYRFALNVLAASDVEVQVSGGSTPGCVLKAYTDFNFRVEISPALFDPTSLAQFARINPAAGNIPLVQETVIESGVSHSLHLLPVSVYAMQPGTCTIAVRPRPTAVRILEAMVAAGGYEPLLSKVIPTGANYATVYRAGRKFIPQRVKLAEPLFSQGLASLPRHWIAQPAAEPDTSGHNLAFDVLGLLKDSHKSQSLSVGKSGGKVWMNLYRRGTNAGLGPFKRYTRSKAVDEIAFPATVSRTFDETEPFQVMRFELDSSQRVALWSSGQPDTYATLADSLGVMVADDEDGAPDGRGFRIVRTLAAGSYDLKVGGTGKGSFELHTSVEQDLPIPDEGLWSCLNAHHVDFIALAAMKELSCFGEGIKSLQGLEAATGLEVLELGRNDLQDVSTLSGLTKLRQLGLAGNNLSNLEPLASLPQLLVLNVAGNPTSAAQLSMLEPLAAHLRELDLAGVEGLSENSLNDIRQRLPYTVILAPDGSVLR